MDTLWPALSHPLRETLDFLNQAIVCVGIFLIKKIRRSYFVKIYILHNIPLKCIIFSFYYYYKGVDKMFLFELWYMSR